MSREGSMERLIEAPVTVFGSQYVRSSLANYLYCVSTCGHLSRTPAP